jgi:hypothetical protein
MRSRAAAMLKSQLKKEALREASHSTTPLLPIPDTFAEFFIAEFGYTLFPEQLRLYEIFEEFIDTGKGMKVDVSSDQKPNIVTLAAMRTIGKTDIITCAGLCYELLRDPNLTFIVASKSLNGIKNITNKIKDILTKYTRVSPKHCNSKEIRTLHNLSAPNKEASVSFVLVGTRLQGMRAMYIICDDLVSHEDSSRAIREQTHKAYTQLFNVAYPKSVLLIGQLAHEEDLFAWLAQKEDVRRYTAWWAEVSDELKSVLGLTKDVIAIANTERQAGLNYYGIYTKDNMVMYFSDIPTASFGIRSSIVVSIDPSWQGKDRIGVSVGYKEAGVYYAWVFEIDGDFGLNHIAIIDEICSLGASYARVFIEANTGAGMVLKAIKSHCWTSGYNVIIDSYNSTVKKQDRILHSIYPIRNNIILGDNLAIVGTRCDPDCVRNWYQDTSDFDDGIDALAHTVSILREAI